MFTICQTITGTTLCCIFILCIQNRLLHFGLPSDHRHTSCVTKSFIEKMRCLKTSAGCLASGTPCGWSSSWPGSCLSSSFSSRLSPCGTCGGGRSPVCCGVVIVGKQEGHSSPGNQWQQPCHPFWGWPWKSLRSCYCLHHCWACHLRLQQTSGR